MDRSGKKTKSIGPPEEGKPKDHDHPGGGPMYSATGVRTKKGKDSSWGKFIWPSRNIKKRNSSSSRVKQACPAPGPRGNSEKGGEL